MPEQFQRPENAHKRALEFLDVNKPRAAQEVLLDLIKSKRHRSWSKEHEAIMDTLVKLNVELKDSKAAKESLFQVNTVLISGPKTVRAGPRWSKQAVDFTRLILTLFLVPFDLSFREHQISRRCYQKAYCSF